MAVAAAVKTRGAPSAGETQDFTSLRGSQDETVRLKGVPSGQYVSLILENRKAYDVTVTLDIRGSNLKVTRTKPETETYGGFSKTEVARLTAEEPSRRWTLRYNLRWVRGSLHAEHNKDTLYLLPYESGTSHRVSQGYNGRFSHKGWDQYAVDFAMKEGTPVCAARDGVVVDVEESWTDGGIEEEYKGHSNYVCIAQADGTIAEYQHVQCKGVLVEVGQRVTAGERIALSGNTGYSARAHLHFAVHSAVDGKERKSHPVTFTTLQGTIAEPVTGGVYTAR